MSATTVHIAIGNSDDKLTQVEWSRYCREVDNLVRHWAPVVHGAWYSQPTAPWQNACWGFVPPSDPANLKRLIDGLRSLADDYHQDAVAWNVSETTFITPKEIP